jgi:hypothetical protein
MDVEEACGFAFMFFYLRNKRKKNRRKYWIHPFLRDRSSRGVFFTHYVDLRNNPDKFYAYARMTVGTFDELFRRLKEKITGTTTRFRDCIPPEQKLLVTLR